jgi:hypothetical protein
MGKRLAPDSGYLTDDIRLNEAQRYSIEKWFDEVEKNHGFSVGPIEFSHVRHHPMRPERGYDVNFFACDGEHLVVGFCDLYGNGYVNVAEVEWLPNEECPTEGCNNLADREDSCESCRNRACSVCGKHQPYDDDSHEFKPVKIGA